MSQHQKVKILLVALQEALETHGHWQSTPPDAQALASTEPFAVDTLNATEWLQWIFIPKMGVLVEQGTALPTSFAIAPYIEEAMRGQPGHDAITRVSMDIDALFNPQ